MNSEKMHLELGLVVNFIIIIKNQYGWVIGIIQPIEKDGSNHIDNLIPLQWENNELINQGVTDRKVTANRIRNELVIDTNHGQDIR